jgi:hypothetical protein
MRFLTFIESFRPPASRYGMPSDGLGDAFGPGSRAPRRTNLRCPAPTGFDPYRSVFGDVPRNPFNRGE